MRLCKFCVLNQIEAAFLSAQRQNHMMIGLKVCAYTSTSAPLRFLSAATQPNWIFKIDRKYFTCPLTNSMNKPSQSKNVCSIYAIATPLTAPISMVNGLHSISLALAFFFSFFCCAMSVYVYIWGGPLWIFHGFSQAKCVLILRHRTTDWLL